MDTIRIKKLNEALLQIETEKSISLELSERFTFEVPGARFMPKFKSGQWDGKCRIFNRANNTIPYGLIEEIIDFGKTRQYDVTIDSSLKTPRLPCTKKDLDDFITNISIPEKIEKRDYQINSFIRMMQQQRGLLISPTGSGKSFMMYLMLRYFLKHDLDNKILVVVPNIQLVSQLTKDFLFYSSEDKDFGEEDIHQIFSGQEKNTDKPIIISTWQSIFRLDKKWFQQFGMFMCDECLHPDTKISMADGSTKPIKDIKIGDKVISYNEKTSELNEDTVIKVHKNMFNSMSEKRYKITTTCGEELIITGNHNVYTENGKKRADKLTTDDVIIGI